MGVGAYLMHYRPADDEEILAAWRQALKAVNVPPEYAERIMPLIDRRTGMLLEQLDDDEP